MGDGELNICSLLPSATEIVCALGLVDSLVGVTHECDYPPEVLAKPCVTRGVIDSHNLSAREIDQAVRESLIEQSTIYHLDNRLLDELQPDLILTQQLCDVCAVGASEVQEVVRGLRKKPQVVSLEPSTINDMLETITIVGRLTGTSERARVLTGELRGRLERISMAVRGLERLRVLTLEWVDPVFVGGHWIPEMVDMAGGQDVVGRAGLPSREATWDELGDSSPDVIVAMPCGFDLQRSLREMHNWTLPEVYFNLPAFRNGQVYVVDGMSYFSRPGPRLIEGTEILASILHPEVWSTAPVHSYEKALPEMIAGTLQELRFESQ